MFKARKSKGRELDFAKLKKPGIYYFNLRGVVRFPDPPKTTIRCHYVGLSRNVYLRIKGHIQKKNELIRINEQLITCERELTKVTKKFYAIVKQLARLPSTSNKQRREHIKQKNKLNVKLAALCKEIKNLEKKKKKISMIDKQLAKYPPAEYKKRWTLRVVMLDEIKDTGMIDTIEELQPIKNDKNELLSMLEIIGIMTMKSLYPNGYNMMLHMPQSMTYVKYDFEFSD